MNIRKEFKTETGKEIDITTRVFAHTVTHINPEYVLWLERRLKNSIVLPSDKVIKDRVAEHENYHLDGMREDYNEVLPIKFAAMCCANSFNDCIRWLKDYKKRK